MKQAIQPGRINVPRRPHGRIGMQGIIGCLAECVMAIQQLRDRPVFYNQSSPGGGGGDIDHMWEVTSAGQSDDETPVPLVKVRGGVLTVQGTTGVVADVNELPAGTTGFVCLEVVRNSASRAYVSHEIQWHATTAPTSADAYEYYILASIADGKITQHRFEDIISYEMMHVANGEFALVPLAANARNTYPPPVP